jgi:hypothetical protein
MVFVDWMNRLQRLVDEMVITFPKMSQVNCWTELNNDKLLG